MRGGVDESIGQEGHTTMTQQGRWSGYRRKEYRRQMVDEIVTLLASQ